MKKKFLFGVFILFISISTFAQDQLFKKDNSKLEVKILEINPSQIKYKLKANPDGPTYVVSKSDVALIIYANGEHEAFKEEQAPVQNTQPIYVQAPQSRYASMDSIISQRNRQKLKDFEEVTKGNNIIFYNMAELVNSGIGLSYFRELAKNLVDIQVPVSFSLGEPYGHNLISTGIYNNYYNLANYKTTQKAFDIGLGIYINTSGKRPVTHFIGPLFRIAQYNGAFQTIEAGNVYQTHGFVYDESYFMINNGFLFRITPHFNMMINGAFGLVTAKNYVANNPATFQVPNSNYYNYYYSPNVAGPTVQFGFHMGYRF